MANDPQLNERGYILVHDLAMIRAASSILREAALTTVPEDERTDVMQKLWLWASKLSDQVNEASSDDEEVTP